MKSCKKAFEIYEGNELKITKISNKYMAALVIAG
jgi:hypothetical protein